MRAIRTGSIAASGGSSPPPSPPVVNSVTLDNTTPTAGDTITATVDATGATSITYQWLADGTPISGQTGQSYTADRDNAMGHALTCTAIAHNTGGDSDPVTSDPTAACTGVPVNIVAPLAVTNGANAPDGPTHPADNMSFDPMSGGSLGTWTGYPAQADMTFTYLWSGVGTPADTNSYTVSGGDVGNNIKCTVTATNTAGNASADSNAIACENS